jgi:Cu(I)/Ag(I) efflux system membrane protein CusA/SilA
MVGGMFTVPLPSMLVLPAAYRLLWRRRLARGRATTQARHA